MKHFLIKNKLTICGAGGGGGGGGSPSPPPPAILTQYPAVLTPPSIGDMNTISSFSYAEMIDLLTDGPIEGLVNREGRKVYDGNIFEGIYFNDTPVKESSSIRSASYPITKLKNLLKTHWAKTQVITSDKYSVSYSKYSLGDTNDITNISNDGTYIKYIDDAIITTYSPSSSLYNLVNDVNGSFDYIKLIERAFDANSIRGERPFLTKIELPRLEIKIRRPLFDIKEGEVNGDMPLQFSINNLGDFIYFSIGSDLLSSFNSFEMPRSFVENINLTVSGKKTFSKSLISTSDTHAIYTVYGLRIFIWSIYNDITGIKDVSNVLDKYFKSLILTQNDASLYNYTLVQSELKIGSEVQTPLKNFANIEIDTTYNKELIGPFKLTNAMTPNNALSANSWGGVQRLKSFQKTINTCPLVNIDNLAFETSDDIRYIKAWPVEYDNCGNPFLICNMTTNYSQFDSTSASRVEQAAQPITHYVENQNVTQAYVTIQVNSLSDTNHIDLVYNDSPSVYGGRKITKYQQTDEVPAGMKKYSQLPGNTQIVANSWDRLWLLVAGNSAGDGYVIDGIRGYSKGTELGANLFSILYDNACYNKIVNTVDGLGRTIPNVATKIDTIEKKYYLDDCLYKYMIPNELKLINESFCTVCYYNNNDLMQKKLQLLDDNGNYLYYFGLNSKEKVFRMGTFSPYSPVPTVANIKLPDGPRKNIIETLLLNINNSNNKKFYGLYVDFYTSTLSTLRRRAIVGMVLNRFIPWSRIFKRISYSHPDSFYGVNVYIDDNVNDLLINAATYPAIYKYIVQPTFSENGKISNNQFTTSRLGNLLLVAMNWDYLNRDSQNWNESQKYTLKLSVIESLLEQFLFISADSSATLSSIDPSQVNKVYSTPGLTKILENLLSTFEIQGGNLISLSNIYSFSVGFSTIVPIYSQSETVSSPLTIFNVTVDRIRYNLPDQQGYNIYLPNLDYNVINGNDVVFYYDLVNDTIPNTNQVLSNNPSYWFDDTKPNEQGVSPAPVALDFSKGTQNLTAGTRLPAIVAVQIETGYDSNEKENWSRGSEYFSYKFDIFGMANSSALLDLGRRQYDFVYGQQLYRSIFDLNRSATNTTVPKWYSVNINYWVVVDAATLVASVIVEKDDSGSQIEQWKLLECGTGIDYINFNNILVDYNESINFNSQVASSPTFCTNNQLIYPCTLANNIGHRFANPSNFYTNQYCMFYDNHDVWLYNYDRTINSSRLYCKINYRPNTGRGQPGNKSSNYTCCYTSNLYTYSNFVRTFRHDGSQNFSVTSYAPFQLRPDGDFYMRWNTCGYMCVGDYNCNYKVKKMSFQLASLDYPQLAAGAEKTMIENSILASDMKFASCNISASYANVLQHVCYVLRNCTYTVTQDHRERRNYGTYRHWTTSYICSYNYWAPTTYPVYHIYKFSKVKTSNYASNQDINPYSNLYSNDKGMQITLPPPRVDSYGKPVRRYIKVTKLSHETLSSLISKSIGLSKITEIIPQRFSYPFSAMVGTKIDARAFAQIPVRTFTCKLKKVLVPTNYFPLDEFGVDIRYKDSSGNIQIYVGDWDGMFKFAWTDNPAWVLMDVLINKRYGLGNYIESNQIDIWELYKIARWCDGVTDNGYYHGVPDDVGGVEPRHAFNAHLTDKFNVFDMVNQIASIFRGHVYYMNSLITFDDDRPKPPIGDFNNSDVKDGLFNYSNHKKDDEFTAVEVTFIDAKDNFKPKIEYIEDTEGIRKRGILKKQLNAFGITSRSQARRMGLHFLYQTAKENNSVTFITDTRALLYKPGDLININDELFNSVRNFGYIKAVEDVNSTVFKIVIDKVLDNTIYEDSEISLYTPIAKPKYEDVCSKSQSIPETVIINQLNYFVCNLGAAISTFCNGSCISYQVDNSRPIQFEGPITFCPYGNIDLQTSVQNFIAKNAIYNVLTPSCLSYLRLCTDICLSYIPDRDLYNNVAKYGHWEMNFSISPNDKLKFDVTKQPDLKYELVNKNYFFECVDTARLMKSTITGTFGDLRYLCYDFDITNNKYCNIQVFDIKKFCSPKISFADIIENDKPSIETFYICHYSTGSLTTGKYINNCYISNSETINEYTEIYLHKYGRCSKTSDNTITGGFTKIKDSVKLNIDTITVNSSYALKIRNRCNQTYKIMSMAENYINEYSILATQYNLTKYQEIEEKKAIVENLSDTFNALTAYNTQKNIQTADLLKSPIIQSLERVQYKTETSYKQYKITNYLEIKWATVINTDQFKLYIETPSKQTSNFYDFFGSEIYDTDEQLYIARINLDTLFGKSSMEIGTYTVSLEGFRLENSLYKFSPKSQRTISIIDY